MQAVMTSDCAEKLEWIFNAKSDENITREETDNHKEPWVLNIRHGLEIKSMKPNLLN